jgi:predicted NBD/HSP70 family sugar kinase
MRVRLPRPAPSQTDPRLRKGSAATPCGPHPDPIRLGAIIIPPVVSHVPTGCQAAVASMQRSTPTSLMLRRMTASAVLDALRAGGPMTGSDLIHATGLARPTVHVVCNDLIRLGWIRETESRRPTGDNRRGRPARCYEFQSRAGFVLGIDATDRVTVRLADLRGDRMAEASRPLAHVSVPADERLAAIRLAADTALASAAVDPARVLAVTVGVPTPVDADGRPVGREAYLPGLPGRDLGPEIGGRHGWPVLVENDANLAAWGERWRGVAAGVDDLVVMVADERLGSGLFLGGRPVRGHAGGAGELRFFELIERVGSTFGIAYLVRTLGAEAVADPRLRKAGGRGRVLWSLAGGDPTRVEPATVLEAARAGDEVALEIVDRVADRMAHAVATLAGMLDPELVVISGAVADDGDLFLDRIRRRLLPDLIDTPPRVLMSILGDQAVVLGAVRMALDHVEASLLGSSGASSWPEAPALAAAPP